MMFEQTWIDEINKLLPELPEVKRVRFMSHYRLPPYDAGLLIDPKEMAQYFEDCVQKVKASEKSPDFYKKTKTVSNWLLGDFNRLLNSTGSKIEEVKITPEKFAEFVDMVEGGEVSGPAAKTVFEEMFLSGKNAGEIVKEKGLSQISDNTEIENAVDTVLNDNPKAVADFQAGKEQAIGFLVGQIMKATKGRANPGMVREILVAKLGGVKDA
jgi:aspartyl-tRNA(Asn)/glutamyl-tRNA(Gln) amidotransferase subunit B